MIINDFSFVVEDDDNCALQTGDYRVVAGKLVRIIQGLPDEDHWRFNPEKINKIAHKEIEQEQFREAVEKEKVRIKHREFRKNREREKIEDLKGTKERSCECLK